MEADNVDNPFKEYTDEERRGRLRPQLQREVQLRKGFVLGGI